MISRKTKIITGVVIGIVCVALLLFFIVFNGGKGHFIPGIYALPQDAIIFYKGEDFKKAYDNFSESELWKGIKGDSSILGMERQLVVLDSLINEHSSVKSVVKRNEIIVSVHKTSLRNLDLLCLIQTKKKLKMADVLALIPGNIRSRQIKTTFEGYEIFDFKQESGKSFVSFSFFDGVLAVSKNPVLVEDAIRTFLKNKLINQSSFSVLSSRKNGEWNLNFKMLTSFLGLFIKHDVSSQLSGLTSFSGIGNYTMEIQKEFLALRGEFLDADTGSSFLSQFYNQKPGQSELPLIVPFRTSMLFSFFVSDNTSFHEQFRKRIEKEGGNADYEVSVKRFERIHKTGIESDIIPLLADQYGMAVVGPAEKDLKKSVAVLVKVKNNETASGFFAAATASIPMADSSNAQQNGLYKDYRVYKNRFSGLFQLLFGKMFGLPNETYFVNIRNFLVFSGDIKVLQTFIDDQIAGKTLSSSPEYIRMAKNITSEANMFCYLNTTRALDIPSPYLDDEVKKRFESCIPLIRKVSSISLQITNNNNSFYSEIVFNNSQNISAGNEIIWQAELDTNMINEPFIVKNHNTGESEVVVFDGRNNMYLISNNGGIQFKRKLNAALVGDIYQVDFFDNQKLQYLFITENHIQLIDRLGRDVANYPIRLAASAASGMAVFDPGKDADIKYFISCTNNNIYGYNLPGKPLAGWNPKSINGVLPYPLKIITLAGKTYLFALSSNGYVYLWDNKADVIKPVNTSTAFLNPVYFNGAADFKNARLIFADTNGSTFFLSLDGKTSVMSSMGNSSSNVYFEVKDVLTEPGAELIYSKGNTIVFYDNSGKMVRSVNLPYEMSQKPRFVSAKGSYCIAFYNSIYSKLFLCDLNGKTIEGFPIDCNGHFTFADLNKDTETDIIFGQDNKIIFSTF